MAISFKVPLERGRHYRKKERYTPPEGHAELPLTAALPFYQSKPGAYVHRIRSGTIFIRHGAYSHTGLSMWCGMSGFSEKSRCGQRTPLITAQAPENEVFCATCEGRAIGAGLEGAHKINGRLVRFSPRK